MFGQNARIALQELDRVREWQRSTDAEIGRLAGTVRALEAEKAERESELLLLREEYSTLVRRLSGALDRSRALLGETKSVPASGDADDIAQIRRRLGR